MRHRHIVIALVGLVLMIFGSVPAYAATPRASRGRLMPESMHGTSFAALQSVGAATGWGRVVVRDDDLPSGMHRSVQVWLWGLESRTEYVIVVDDIEIGTIQTKSSGSGVLKLQNLGRGHDPVPDDLPIAELLESTTVYGPDLDPTLQGTFTAVGHIKGDTTYEEEITLVNVPGGEAAGTAEVEMKEAGHQEFKTHATGLFPGSIYSVVVDGLTVASVTADEQGQARAHLEDPDDDNPLPPELIPVSEIVSVEWWDAEGLLLLSGTFTGVGICEHIMGAVTEVSDGSFTIETYAGPVTVVTTDDTEWDDFGDHELTVGDMVKVEGCWDSDDFVAEEVELKGGDDDEDCEKFVGTVTGVSDGSFTIETDAGPVTVVTADDTEWDDFGDHDLTVGDMVKVEGCWVGDDFVAAEIELKKVAKLRHAA